MIEWFLLTDITIQIPKNLLKSVLFVYNGFYILYFRVSERIPSRKSSVKWFNTQNLDLTFLVEASHHCLWVLWSFKGSIY